MSINNACTCAKLLFLIFVTVSLSVWSNHMKKVRVCAFVCVSLFASTRLHFPPSSVHLHLDEQHPACVRVCDMLVYSCISQGKLEAWTRRFTLLLARLYCHSASLCRVCTRMLQLWFYNVNQLSYHSTTSKSTSSILVLPVSHCWVIINISRKDLPVLYWLNSPVAHSTFFFNLTDFYVLSL